MTSNQAKLEFYPVTPDRWGDMEDLFGPRGATGGCWCMYLRLKGSEFEKLKGGGTKKLMQGIVAEGDVPGVIAYKDGQPTGWCSVAPRQKFSRLDRSPVLKRVDDQPVWSIVCFFIPRQHRRQGIASALLAAAVDYAKSQGASIVEAYPIEPRKDEVPDPYIWPGLADSFRQAGFKEVARRSRSRPIMRYFVEADQ